LISVIRSGKSIRKYITVVAREVMARILKYSIEQILEQNQDLPSLPASLLQVIDATSQSDCNVKALTYFIAQDPALSVRVLKLANSAYYGQTKKG
jgi:HD-like signal output (HDOD) protein